MTYGHPAGELGDPLFIEDLRNKTVTLYPMKLTVRSHRHDAAALLTPVLKGVQAIVSKTCSILNTIDSKNATFVVELVIPVIVGFIHFCQFRLSSRFNTGRHSPLK